MNMHPDCDAFPVSEHLCGLVAIASLHDDTPALAGSTPVTRCDTCWLLHGTPATWMDREAAQSVAAGSGGRAVEDPSGQWFVTPAVN